MKKKNLMINNILNFWFFECTEKDWFKKDLKFDQLIQKKFLKSVKAALQNKLNLCLIYSQSLHNPCNSILDLNVLKPEFFLIFDNEDAIDLS